VATKPETVFTNAVHRHLPPLSQLYREKMHNPYRGGTFDYWYSGKTADLWIEYKFIVLPARSTTVIRMEDLLSPLQREWGRGRAREGRNVWVIVGHRAGGVVLSQGEARFSARFTTDEFALQTRSRQSIADAIVSFVQGPS
jgi:hypothetical protein